MRFQALLKSSPPVHYDNPRRPSPQAPVLREFGRAPEPPRLSNAMPWIAEKADTITAPQMQKLVAQTAAEARQRICARPKRVLLLPPDITRAHSGAGASPRLLYQHFAGEAEVHVIPTLGQHVPHTPAENTRMFGSVPEERIHAHDWRGGSVQIGEISGKEVAKTCGGVADWPIPISLNRMLIEEPWDLIINVGHVVPHEVLGFANHNKNYFIGLGGKELISAAHMMAATCGIENNLGNLITPVRECFNRAEDQLLGKLPDLYVQIVMARNKQNELVHTGVCTSATTWRPICRRPDNRASRTSRSSTSR